MSITVYSGLKTKILEAQGEAFKDLKALAEWLRGLEKHFERRDDGGISFFGRIWIPLVGGVRKWIMDEVHILIFNSSMKRWVRDIDMSTGLPPQTDGQSERTIQTLKDMLRACVMDFGSSWDTHLLLIEFSYNNNYHTSIKCAPFEALYGKKCRSPVIWTEVGENVQVPLDEIEIDENLRFVEEPIEVMERDEKKLKRRRIPLVKVS
ncbi:putative reverse transcriptase domain-containing protein [Tanacetum coccineum]